MSPFLHFISYLLRLCHLTLINLNEIAPKVNNAVITSKKYRLREVVIFSPKGNDMADFLVVNQM